MPVRCWRCGREAFDASLKHCECCDRDTSHWHRIDVRPVSNRLRHSLLHSLNAVLRGTTHHYEYNISVDIFGLIFSPGSPDIEDTKYESDSDFEDEERPTKCKLVLRSVSSIAQFAAFHELQDKGERVKDGCRGMRVLTSGEVAILVPPLTAVWSLTPKGTNQVRVSFNWALLTNAGTVGGCSNRLQLHKRCFELLRTLLHR